MEGDKGVEEIFGEMTNVIDSALFIPQGAIADTIAAECVRSALDSLES